MTIPAAIVGLEPIQQDWIRALHQAHQDGLIKLVAVGHELMTEARKSGQDFDVPFYVDLRRMMLETAPRIVLIDRPRQFPLDFIEACLQQEIGVFSLGPPVHTLAEAHRLNLTLPPRTHLLYVWPRMSESWAWRQCAPSDDYLRGGIYLKGCWAGINHAAARNWQVREGVVRSLSVLAWDACHTVLELLGLPAALYASLQGTLGDGDQFIDVTGHAAITMRFLEATANVTISDQETPARRELMLFSPHGALRLDEHSFRFTAAATGQTLEEDSIAVETSWRKARRELEEFCRQFTAPPSPQRGWPHGLIETASMMTALLVSHRTNNAESPQHFRSLR